MKDISAIDKNFLQDNNLDLENTDFYDVKEKPFLLYGVFYDEKNKRYTRLPQAVAKTINPTNDNIEILSCQTSGGRIRFSTNSEYLTVIVKYDNLIRMPHMPLEASSGLSLCENVEKREKFICMFSPGYQEEKGYAGKKRLRYIINNKDKKVRNYTLFLPLYNGVNEIILGFDKGSTVGEGVKYEDIKPILYYGSSITQGGCATRADLSYQAIISKNNNIDFINLGFSGCARGEATMARYLSNLECSVFVMDYDHNAPDVEHLKNTHFNFYLEFRKNNKNSPILFISRPNHKDNLETFSYMSVKTARKRYEIINDTYEKAKQMGDDKVYLLNGSKIFGKDYELCTVDGTHPNSLGFYKMAKSIQKKLLKIFSENLI